jgi:maleylpyruvate isomerase
MQAEDIESGAGRPAAAVIEDVSDALHRLECAFDSLPDGLWDREGICAPGPRTMAEIVFRHLRDVEVHHADLGLGYTPEDWPEIYVEGELERRLPHLADRANRARLVAWLIGRGPAPELGPW